MGIRVDFRKFRQAKDLSLKELSALTGISVQRLFAIEQRGKEATIDEIKLIAEATQTPVVKLQFMLEDIPF